MLFLVAEGAWIGAAVLAIAAALFDARTGRVPMPLLVPFLIAGCLARLAVPLLLGIPHVDVILASYVGVGISVVVGSLGAFIAWRREMIGGDAVVLAAALSLLLPLEGVAGLIVVTLVWALLTRLQRGANDAPTIDRAPRLRITPFFLALTLLVVAVALVTKLRSS